VPVQNDGEKSRDHLKQRLGSLERPHLLWILSQLIHELTIRARFYYDQPNGIGPMQETNETIHRVSGHCRDLTTQDEPFTSSRADSIDEALKLLSPPALDRLYEFMT
jgi:hypothetical protein